MGRHDEGVTLVPPVDASTMLLDPRARGRVVRSDELLLVAAVLMFEGTVLLLSCSAAVLCAMVAAT